uniref:hypothetical protein n=1 Tax=Algoriphagus sp. TaxID=1872435 RepID=UPI00404795BF
MKKFIILILLFWCYQVQGQDLFFKTGVNSTLYKFKDKDGVQLNSLIPKTGTSFHLGAGLPLLNDLLRYELGLTVDAYNSSNEDPFTNYSWNTTYGGVKNSLGFFPLADEFAFGLIAHLGFSKILSGTQLINNSNYSIRTHPEFSGLMVQPGLGLAISYNFLNDTFLSLQYDYSKCFRFRNTQEERLSFTNNRLVVGVHIQID